MNEVPTPEFEAAFAEASGQTADLPADPQVDPQPPEAEPAASDDMPTPAAETPPEGEAEPVTPDIWSNVAPEAKAAFDAAEARARTAEHRLKSQEGREAAFQGHLHELRKQLREVGGSVTEQEDPLAFMASEEWTKTKAEYGDDLKPVFTAMETLADRLKNAEGRFGQMDAQQEEALWERNFTLFSKDAPDWEQLLFHKDLSAWVEQQPRHLQEAFERNREHVMDPVEAVDVMNRFRAHVAMSSPPQSQQTQLDHKRAAQLDGARAVTTKTPPVADTTDDSFEAHFAQAARARERQAVHR